MRYVLIVIWTKKPYQFCDIHKEFSFKCTANLSRISSSACSIVLFGIPVWKSLDEAFWLIFIQSPMFSWMFWYSHPIFIYFSARHFHTELLLIESLVANIQSSIVAAIGEWKCLLTVSWMRVFCTELSISNRSKLIYEKLSRQRRSVEEIAMGGWWRSCELSIKIAYNLRAVVNICLFFVCLFNYFQGEKSLEASMKSTIFVHKVNTFATLKCH